MTSTATNTTGRALTFATDGAGGGGANAQITVASGAAGNFTIGVSTANIILSSNLDVVHNGSGTLTLDRVITGTSMGITKSGSGTLILSVANTFSGQLTVADGVLQVPTINNNGANGTLGNNALSVILGNTGGFTGTLRYTGGTATSTKKFTMASAGTGAFQVDNGATTLTLSGVVDGGGGTLTMSNTNALDGALLSPGMDGAVLHPTTDGVVLRPTETNEDPLQPAAGENDWADRTREVGPRKVALGSRRAALSHTPV